MEYKLRNDKTEAAYYSFVKFIFLSLTFFCIIGAYTVVREIKDSIFAFVIGREYIPFAKLITLIAFIPCILLYSKLVDNMRRYYVLCFYSFLYAALMLVFAFFVAHPSIGILNTNATPYRWFGWLLYLFIEGYSPFVVSVFWAFANSISSPDEAKQNYGFVVAASKVGGMLTSAFAWFLLTKKNHDGALFFSDVFNHQLLLLTASVLLFIVVGLILALMRYVPGHFLHGYEVVYQLQKKKGLEKTSGVFSGLVLLAQYPYVLGIFGMVYFYEVVTTVLSYLRVGIAKAQATTISDATGFLFQIIFFTHLVGLVISLVGTRSLLYRFGTKTCLLFIPLVSGFALMFFMFFQDSGRGLVVAFIILKAMNYAFSWPVRESLYIPTIKEIKFKSKSWIDAFGSKFAKTTGSAFNLFASHITMFSAYTVHGLFFTSVVMLWFVTAYLLGRRFETAIKRKEAIGASS
ncbi:MAG: Npt1/Npt2 family nucleotide transporter [Candidatus Babeliales bacterium]